MREPDFEHDDLDDQNEHVDERWLVSYADMMTLLFGLFVMLYAMSGDQMRPENAEKIQTSIRDNFGAPMATPAPTPGPAVAVMAAPSRNESGTKGDVPGDRPGKISVKDEPIDGADLDAKTKARMQAAGQPNPVVAPAAPAPEPTEDTSDLEERLRAARERAERAKKDLGKANAELAQQKLDIDKSTAKIAELEAQLNSLKEEAKTKAAGPLPGDGENKRSFISTFIQWDTEKHDVDMTIVHPNGKTFSYKKRQFTGMTGNFILDSRQGPGMEVWQDAMLTPGRYELRAKLYNDYGNHKPAVVKGSILTVKGRLDLPTVELTMKKNPEASYIFNVDPEGNVRLENKPETK